MAEKERPGVMLYFDVRPSLKRLSMEETGRLFEMILDYAQYGEVPEPEGMLGVAWDFIQPRIDRDAERYEEISENRRKAALKRWEGRDNVQTDANASFALQVMPTTTATTTTTSTPSPIATATAAAARRECPGPEELAGELAFEDLRRRKMRMLSGMLGDN